MIHGCLVSMLLKSARKSREIGAGTGIEALKFSMSHDYEIWPSGFPQGGNPGRSLHLHILLAETVWL